MVIIEPDKDEYDSYSTHINIYPQSSTESESEFMKTQLIGRTSYFYISLKNDLTEICSHKNCILCLENSPNICITCESDYYFDIIEGTKIKKCNDSELELDTTIIETTQPEIPTTQPKIPSTQPKIPSTQPKIPSTQPKIPSTQPQTTTTQPDSTVKEEDSKTEKSTQIDSTEATTEKITERIKTNDNCSPQGIINNLCHENVNENQSEDIYKQLKEDCLNIECAKQNKIVETNNIIYQISTLEEQKNNNNPNVSSIELGEDCEEKLRKENKMTKEDDFIIYKKDIKDGLTTYVEYEIYNSKTLILLNLDICNDSQISINVPVNLKEETQLLYAKMNRLGYNLFDANDSFYNDICSIYTSDSGTDMLLSDRKEDIFKKNGNLTLCQSGCQLESYNEENKKAKCSCRVQETKIIDTKNIDTSEKFDKQDFADSFFATLKNSNFMVVKCYKLVLTLDYLLKNIGRIIMTGILGINIILIFVCIIIEKNKINVYISSILRNKIYNRNKYKTEKKRNSSQHSVKNKRNSTKRTKSFSKFRKKKSSESGPPKKDNNVRKSKKAKTKKDQKGSKKNLYKPKNEREIKSIKKDLKKSKKVLRQEKENSSIKKLNIKSDSNTLISSKKSLNRKPTINININKLNIKRVSTKSKSQNLSVSVYQPKEKMLNESKKYNSRELNSLSYQEALIYDKRSYFQYYGSLLMQKQLILFTFCPDDYNLYSIKIVLFLLSFSLYFSVNGLFFSDDTMHKLYEDKGAFNLLYQIPQIMYSTVVSAIINTVLKQLSLSEKNILKLKQEENYEIALKKSKAIKNCLIIKFIIFFVLTLLLTICFWYFISCFCAVFSNTQYILIKDTLISFGLSMLYPFGLNLLPGFFRIPALSAKDRECLYKISSIVALI